MKRSFLFASAASFAISVSALHLPFARQAAARTSGILSKRNPTIFAQSGSLGLDNTLNNVYSSSITINGKNVPVNLDTGSTDFWLYDYEPGLLDNAQVYSNLELTLRYGRGGVTGNIGQTNVEFAGFSVANQSFLYVTSQNQTSIIENKSAAGLLGLGFDTLSDINRLVAQTFSGATWGRSLLSNIFLSDLSTPNHIAFRLDRLYDGNDTDTGSFDIGTFASGLEAVNGTAEIPVFSSSPSQNIYWTVLVDGFAVNGKNQTLQTTITNGTVPPDGKVAAVLDTGYSLPQLRPELAAAIYEPLGGVFDTDSAMYVVPCEAQTNVTFYIGGRTIPIHPLDLTFVLATPVNGQNMTICFGAFQPFSSEAGGGLTDLILGDAFLRNTYTVYDFGDFINGTSGDRRQDPYVKLLPLTDPGAASTEFQSARKSYLDTLPPQLNVSTLSSGNPQAIPGSGSSGSNGAMRFGMNVRIAFLATTLVVGATNWF
ncbi:unnamed protein product [Rhizoctonia solani]|uniref:Peptidase A1 domain-containing protein n=1 Tax=Rhizoctonia solani TaxID=456999 RepID=A0A8H2XJD5_9AGAM|nr:unnamed protein product [Rhizoctonia solani]